MLYAYCFLDRFHCKIYVKKIIERDCEILDKKSTDNLEQELMNSPDLDRFLAENKKEFTNESVSGLLNKLFSQKNLSKAELARQAGMSEIYMHQIFSGRRNPSRNRLICLCIGMNATVKETQEILKSAKLAPLYPKVRRDAIIYYGILHGASLFEINDKLFEEEEIALY